MITENKLHHILAVARRCYNLAKLQGCDEDFCERMFMAGWCHDVGYEFLDTPEGHSKKSADLVQSAFGCDNNLIIEAIRNHGEVPIENLSIELKFLILADLTTDSHGNEVPVDKRLEEIRERYGVDSTQYIKAHRTAKVLGFV